MFRSSVALALLMAGALAAAGCTTSPTAPSTTPSGILSGVASLEPPPTPQAIIPVPPQRLGATSFLAFGDSITFGVLSSFDGAFLYEATEQAYTERYQDPRPRDDRVAIEISVDRILGRA